MAAERGTVEEHLKAMRLKSPEWLWTGVLAMKMQHLQTCGCYLCHCYYLGQRRHLQALEHAYKFPLLSASGVFASAVVPLTPLEALPGLVALGAVPAAPVSWMSAAAQDWNPRGDELHKEMMSRRQRKTRKSLWWRSCLLLGKSLWNGSFPDGTSCGNLRFDLRLEGSESGMTVRGEGSLGRGRNECLEGR